MRLLGPVLSVLAVTAALIIVPSSALAKSCSSSYVNATIGGAQKCLRRGEFCAHRYASQYRRYGFSCILKSGEYHLEPR